VSAALIFVLSDAIKEFMIAFFFLKLGLFFMQIRILATASVFCATFAVEMYSSCKTTHLKLRQLFAVPKPTRP